MSDENEFEEEAAAAGLDDAMEKPGIGGIGKVFGDMSVDEFLKAFDIDEFRNATNAIHGLNGMVGNVKKAREAGQSLGEYMKVGMDQLEIMYSMAYMSYQFRRVAESAMLFTQLVCLNPRDERFTFGLGSSLKAMSRYEEALLPFMLTAGLNVKSASACWYSAECSWMTGEKEMTVDMLEETIRRAPLDPDGERYAKLAQAMLDSINDGAVPPDPGRVRKVNIPEREPEFKAPPPEEMENALPKAGGGRRRFRV